MTTRPARNLSPRGLSDAVAAALNECDGTIDDFVRRANKACDRKVRLAKLQDDFDAAVADMRARGGIAELRMRRDSISWFLKAPQ